jgi:rod shape-determining protein MreD
MRPRVYFIVFLLLIPLQASLFNPLSLGGIKPDLGLALLFIIGLIAGPAEGALAGIAMGLLQDIGSASVLGLTGITRGIIGLSAGLLGKRVLDFRSPANSIFLAVFSVLEGFFIAVFMQVFYGSVPFFRILSGRILPQAFYTALLGFALLQLLRRKDFITALQRRAVHKES